MDAGEQLEHLKFTPRSSAWKHVQKFEKLVNSAYPRIPDAHKWSLFVKTIDSPNNPSWNSVRNGMTPARWLMELNEQWIRDNPPCDNENCNSCKDDAMTFDYLKSAFLDRWGSPNDARRHMGPSPPSRTYSMPPSSHLDSGSDVDSETGGHFTPSHVNNSLIPHARLPPSAPTPPNEPVSGDEVIHQETKTSISINAEAGTGQIVLSISNNDKKKSKPRKGRPHPLAAEDSPSDREGDSSPPPPAPPIRVIEAAPEPEPVQHQPQQMMMEMYHPPSPPHHHPHHPHHHEDEMAVQAPPTPPRSGSPLTPQLRPRLLEGKVAAITGCSRGIGRAIALGFAQEGAHIVAHYWGTKSDPANDEIVSLCVEIRSLGQGCTIVYGDIADPRTSETVVRRAVETYGRLDIAVANAGMCWYKDFIDVPPEMVRRHMDVNVLGTFWFVQSCARQFRRQYLDLPADAPPDSQHYSILAIAGSAGEGQGPKAAHFNATAAAVKELMKSCCGGLARFGVRCNTICPGVVQTKMVKSVVEDLEVRGRWEKRNPFGRLGVPGDVVGPAVWLAGEGGKWINGQEVVVDGGSGAM